MASGSQVEINDGAAKGAPDTSSEDEFSSSHSGGLVCNRVDFPRRPPHKPGSSARRTDADASYDATCTAAGNGPACSRAGQPPKVDRAMAVRGHRPSIPPAPEISRRWGRGVRSEDMQDIAQPDVGVGISVFDPIMHARVVIVHDTDSLADPVQAALAQS